jgi:hypothetical protein
MLFHPHILFILFHFHFLLNPIHFLPILNTLTNPVPIPFILAHFTVNAATQSLTVSATTSLTYTNPPAATTLPNAPPPPTTNTNAATFHETPQTLAIPALPRQRQRQGQRTQRLRPYGPLHAVVVVFDPIAVVSVRFVCFRDGRPGSGVCSGLRETAVVAAAAASASASASASVPTFQDPTPPKP